MSGPSDRLATALADRYTIERELGAGGMATVYLAQDLRHDRKVAIKVLRPELAAVIGAERFLSEIKTTANLQHPHILPLFDSGAAGTGEAELRPYLFYVMPFVEGESLRDRLTREKQLPVGDAVRIASEIAGALDYAHRHGVIHRDIKPENILLHDGRALVADFGIALAASKAGGARMTETGMSLGTPTYMSPEQAMGEREITARSDLYALGCVLYEMLIGEPPFTGPTAQAIVAKVMTANPASLSAQRKSIPPAVEAAVLTALEKLPADRFATAAEFALALDGKAVGRFDGRAIREGNRPTAQSPNRRIATSLLGIAAVVAAFLAGRWNGRTSVPAGVASRLSVFAPTIGLGGSSLLRQIAITPDGTAIVYSGTTPLSTNTLFLQRLDADEPVEIAGANALRSPVMSRDGRSLIAYSAAGAFRLPVGGGTPRQLPARVGSSLLGAWSPDGSYWFTDANASGVAQLTPDDSVIPLPRDVGRGTRIMQILDDARTALVVRAPAGSAAGPAMLLDLKSNALSPVLDGPVVEVRAVAGELLCVLLDGSITATPFDVRHHRITGAPVQIGTGVSLSGTGIAHFAVADNGTIVYVPEAPRSLVLVDRNGAQRPALEERLSYHAPKFSPDGSRISFDLVEADGRDVWTLALAQHTLSRATFAHDGHDATWTPDSRFLTYVSFKSGVFGLYRTRPGSTAPAESLLTSARLTYPGSWLADGSALVTTGNDLQGQSSGDIAIVRNGGHGPIEPLVASPFQESYAALSPDGRWLAFASDQSGRQEIYVQPLHDPGDQVQVSQDGGTEAVWGRDGRELFYRGTHGSEVDLVDATVRTTPEFSVTARHTMFSLTDMAGAAPHANFDISPDGRTFVMVRRSPATRINVIQNLPVLLRGLRGVGSKE